MIAFENYYQDNFAPHSPNFKPGERHVRRVMDNIMLLQEITEKPPYSFIWNLSNSARIQDTIRERLSNHSKDDPVLDLAHADVLGKTYYISLDTNSGPQWDMRIKYEYPRQTLTGLFTANGIFTYSMIGIIDLIKPRELCTTHIPTFNVPREDRIMSRIGESEREFEKARELSPHLHGMPENFPKLMDFMISRGFPRWKAIKLKQKFGFEIDPSELDDKTIMDLI